MGFNLVRAMWAQAIASSPSDRLSRMPENIAVTKAGYAGRVHAFPGGFMDQGFIQPEMYSDGEDHGEAERRYRPVDHTPDLYKFARQAHNNPVWKSAEPEKVSLQHPIYATQPHVLRSHVQRYLDKPDDTTKYAKTDPEGAAEYPFTHHPGFVVYRNRLHVVDGHHRVAAAMMRGDSHIQGRVWDADKHGLPMVNMAEHGWGGEDPGPPRNKAAVASRARAPKR